MEFTLAAIMPPHRPILREWRTPLRRSRAGPLLIVFLIQNTQNRDTVALQIKLSELIIAMKGADNKLAAIEDATDEDREA